MDVTLRQIVLETVLTCRRMLECIIVHGSMLSVSSASLSLATSDLDDLYYFTDVRDSEIAHKRGGVLKLLNMQWQNNDRG